jgi:carboxyl-terminal processing protease
MDLLAQPYPQDQAVRITVRWPVTGATRTITISPAVYVTPASSSYVTSASSSQVTSTLLDGHIAYVRFSGFFPAIASQVPGAVSALKKKAALRGVIPDVRGNLGGQSPAQLLGAFEHGTAYSYDCTISRRCTANYPDAGTPLLHLPLVVLTDRNCFSACDAFSGAVKDLHLGTLIGTRTAGIAAGPAAACRLDDGSVLSLPALHELSADHEIINGIGVAPDYDLPLTAYDVATGRDPDIAKALTLLSR